jgi:hypothetical protein
MTREFVLKVLVIAATAASGYGAAYAMTQEQLRALDARLARVETAVERMADMQADVKVLAAEVRHVRELLERDRAPRYGLSGFPSPSVARTSLRDRRR